MAITLNGTTGISSPGGDTSTSLATGTLSVSGTSTLSGNISFPNSTTLTAASTKTLTLNGGGGTNGLVLDASNNVGIGTATPNTKLHVVTAGGNIIQLNSTNASGGYATFQTSGTSVGYLGTAAQLSSGSLSDFCLRSEANLVFGVAGTEKMRLDSSGNLGLGVTPSAWSGSGNLDGQNGFCWSSYDASIGNGYYYSSGYKYKATSAAVSKYVPYNGSHSWYTAPSGTAGNAISFTQVMTLDASGRLIVGNTSQLYGFSGRLYTEASSSSYLPLVALSSYSGDLSNPAGSFYKYDNNSTTSQVFVRFAINNGNAGCGQINGNGASAAAFGSFSDSRLKENITALPDQLANICALKPSEFDYKDGSGHQIGFIAQEMQEVYPDVVGEGEDGMLTITGWSKTEARIVKAIQELTTRLEALEAK